ncbi:MAG: hypothetical protein HOC20_13175 [Chloroflexi bacterium]|jgi:hypothetical protein|nr:hypothetical protein [Chloroflexota bacterium]
MDIFHELWVEKLIYSLGIVNIVLGVLVFFSCRCIPMTAFIGARIMKFSAYQKFYKVHCALWPLLWISVIVHAVFAIGFLGNPY